MTKSDGLGLRPGIILRDAIVITMASVTGALVVNAARSEGLPLLAQEEYQILVPCPEPRGEVMAMPADDPRLFAPDTLVVDARDTQRFAAWHLESARHIPFDYLEPTPAETLRHLVSSGRRRVVIYGDGDDPDSGQELARELAGRGILNVFFVQGGAPALRGEATRGERSEGEP